jgi:hypothetical protein
VTGRLLSQREVKERGEGERGEYCGEGGGAVERATRWRD